MTLFNKEVTLFDGGVLYLPGIRSFLLDFKKVIIKGTKVDPTQKGLVRHINVIFMDSIREVFNKVVVIIAMFSLP